MDKELYQSTVGSLLYLSEWTTPDIAFAVSSVAKFISCSRNVHCIAVKRIMHYIKSTLYHGVSYTRIACDLVGYSNASWTRDLDDRRSVSGYIFMIK